MNGLFGIDPLVTGILLAVIVGVVIIGGVKRIGQVASYLVPFMASFYILAGIAVYSAAYYPGSRRFGIHCHPAPSALRQWEGASLATPSWRP